jgi:hypothetical protein
LAGPQVAQALEALQRIAPRQAPRSLRGANRAQALCNARFCYDHLAGHLAIQLVDAMTTAGLITLAKDQYELTARGASWFEDLEVDVGSLRLARRSFARACLDWSERRPHLAGALGAALATQLLERGWIERTPYRRAVRTTVIGRAQLRKTLGIDA